MSDDTNNLRPLPQYIAQLVGDPEAMAQMDRSCAAALKNQLNINRQNPVLAALETKWKTMDAFSKRELGQQDVNSADILKSQQQSTPVTAQLAPGQKAEVTGPATIHGGNIKPQPRQEDNT